MMPPTPILKGNNWPLLTVSKGFFENLAQGSFCILVTAAHCRRAQKTLASDKVHTYMMSRGPIHHVLFFTRVDGLMAAGCSWHGCG